MGSAHLGYGELSSFTGDALSSGHLNPEWSSSSDILGPVVGILPHLLYQQPPETMDEFNYQEQVAAYDKRRDSAQQGSVPVQELMDEILWPQQRSRFQEEHTAPSLDQDYQDPSSSEVNTSRQMVHSSAESSGDTAHHSEDSRVQKRRRGRPRLYSCTDDMRKAGISSNEVSLLREYNLEKNRVAAEKCRLRKKKLTAALAADFDVLSRKNEALKADASGLREELLLLKNKVLSHAGCGSRIIDGYIAKSAGGQLNAQSPLQDRTSRKDSGQTSATEDHARVLENPAPELTPSETSLDQDGPESHLNTKTLDPSWLMNDTGTMNENWY